MKTQDLCLAAVMLLTIGARETGAGTISIAMTGTIASVFAGPDPAVDREGSPPPPDPAFEEFFAPGQPVYASITYDLGAVDWYDQQITPTPRIGIYRSIFQGSVTVGGINYSLNDGDVSTQLMNNLGEDQLGFDAFGGAVVDRPITAGNVQLTFGIAKPGMLSNDALPTTAPPMWTRSFGHLRFGSSDGLLYELGLTITSVVTVPEPSGMVLLTLAGSVTCASLRRRRRAILWSRR